MRPLVLVSIDNPLEHLHEVRLLLLEPLLPLLVHPRLNLASELPELGLSHVCRLVLRLALTLVSVLLIRLGNLLLASGLLCVLISCGRLLPLKAVR